MSPNKKLGIAAASLAAVAVAGYGAVVATTSALAEPTPSATATSTGTSTKGNTTRVAPNGNGQQAPGQGQGRGPMGGRRAHTPVTGDELAKVTAAIKAKDSAVTVSSVEKDEDGTYDVHGTKAGANVMFDVSADLKTITENAGGGGGKGGPGGASQDAVVTGAEAQKVIDAVQAKDAAAKITSVRKDPDGSYDALGTKDGANVMFDVSSDLKTITQGGGR